MRETPAAERAEADCQFRATRRTDLGAPPLSGREKRKTMNVGVAWVLFVSTCCGLLQWQWFATRAAALRSASR